MSARWELAKVAGLRGSVSGNRIQHNIYLYARTILT